MSRENQEAHAEHWGSPEWVAAQDEGRGRLEAELIDEVRGSQTATHQMDEAAGRAMGVNGTDGRCLDILDRRGRLSAGQLAEASGLTTGAVTAVLDRLEAKGYVSRVPDPGDRRRVLVEITEKQRQAAWRLYGPLGEMAAAWLAERSDDELRLLIEFNRVSREINERRAAQVRAELDG